MCLSPRNSQWISLAVVLLSASGAVGQSCTIYSTGFDSFLGPPDWNEGPFSVAWCLNGSTVTATNFCPTGSALKLDSPSDDPVVLVRVGDTGCASVSLTFTYAQFVATGTTIKASLTNAQLPGCSAPTSTTIGTLSTTGGVCTQVTMTVLPEGAEGVLFRFDHGNTGATAITIDDLSVAVDGCCDETHGCCEEGPAGCADDAVAACVCTQDPYCCAVEWDAVCVAEVEGLGCGDCSGGGTAPPCLTGFATGFGTAYVTSPVCALFPELFESCEGVAPTLTISGACATSGDPAMRFGTGFPYSSAVTRCLDLTATSAPELRFRWTRAPGSLGPRIDYQVAGGDWLVAWQPAFGEGTGACVETVLDLAPISGETEVRFRFVSGSSVANGAAFDDIELAPGASAHDCCTQGAAGCADRAIEACACGLDGYCCEVEWDALCVVIASSECGADCPGILYCGAPDASACDLAHDTPFCADETCCATVCGFDAFCCAESWDQLCVKEAAIACASPVAADLNADGLVNGGDLAMLLSAWGSTGPAAGGADLDGSGTVNGGDLAVLLAAWTG